MEDDFAKLRFINSYSVLDLFSGCGGFSYGLEKSGLEIINGIDIWETAIETFNENHNNKGICKDLCNYPPDKYSEEYKIKNIDIICGGCPCQGFSICGKRNKNDPRNSLFMEYVKYLDYFKPKIFIFENVLGILSMKMQDNTLVIDTIMSYLNKNYNCCINKLNASQFGVPQNRKRVIIIGIRKNYNIKSMPIKPVTDPISVSTVLEDDKDISNKYYLSEKAILGIQKKKERMQQKSYGFGAQFLDLNKPSFTIVSRYYKDGYDALIKYDDKKIRRLTELELKRIQTFPDDYIFKGNRKDQIIQIGNAVPCELGFHIGNYIIDILEQLV